MKNNKSLQGRFNILVYDYLKEFEQKQNADFDYWVGDQIGGVAVMGDHFFGFDDIRYDIDNNIEKGLIFKWQDDSTDYSLKKDTNKRLINYQSYCKGLRYEDLENNNG